MVGASIRHGPHQGAQKSTITGTWLLTTSFSQLADVSSTTFALAICSLPFFSFRALRETTGWAARRTISLHYRGARFSPTTRPRLPALLPLSPAGRGEKGHDRGCPLRSPRRCLILLSPVHHAPGRRSRVMASNKKIRVAIVGLGFGAEFIPIY